ncbi:hypothetical protein DIPPA_24680 [Diplonema papillatum]|nr:hypothetical protein DIPPA_24680 [Diplonema papillatum]|eukprot:gene8593-13287_t
MSTAPEGELHTVGHSNHTEETFQKLLQQHNVKTLVDVRSMPRSGRFPHFSKDPLQAACGQFGIEYLWLGQFLGGRGDQGEDIWGHFAKPGGWEAMASLRDAAVNAKEGTKGPVAIMCSEGDWRTCHRSVISNELVRKHGVAVRHIRPNGSIEEHVPLTPDPKFRTLVELREDVPVVPVEPSETTKKLKDKKKNRLQK